MVKVKYKNLSKTILLFYLLSIFIPFFHFHHDISHKNWIKRKCAHFHHDISHRDYSYLINCSDNCLTCVLICQLRNVLLPIELFFCLTFLLSILIVYSPFIINSSVSFYFTRAPPKIDI